MVYEVTLGNIVAASIVAVSGVLVALYVVHRLRQLERLLDAVLEMCRTCRAALAENQHDK